MRLFYKKYPKYTGFSLASHLYQVEKVHAHNLGVVRNRLRIMYVILAVVTTWALLWR